MIEVYGVGTARTMRVHWMLRELGLEHVVHPVLSRSGETQQEGFLALNPRGKIPVLRDGPLELAESAAIVGYLAERYGGDRGLIPPAGSDARARYDQWAFFLMTELDAHSLYILRRHGDLADLYGEAPQALEAARDYFRQQAAVAAGELRERGPYLMGETFTGVDILLTSCLDWAAFTGETLDAGLAGYREVQAGRPAYAAAARANFPPEAMAALQA
ncbi:MAG: glutathione S-transferase [Deltaproteobacteria bacterium]|nr:glutathione S-transferase [Deltaproteobacteria bacterium]